MVGLNSFLHALSLLTFDQVLPGMLLDSPNQNFTLRSVQICEKQCRDENGFKCHTQAESHVRNALLVGEASLIYLNKTLLLSLTELSRTLENTFQTSQTSSKETFCNSFVQVMWRRRCISITSTKITSQISNSKSPWRLLPIGPSI